MRRRAREGGNGRTVVGERVEAAEMVADRMRVYILQWSKTRAWGRQLAGGNSNWCPKLESNGREHTVKVS